MSQAGEDRLKQIVTAVLKPHFHIHPEEWGTVLGGSKRIRIDLVIIPKAELIEKGFAARAVGVEVKEPDGNTSKAAKHANQARTYADAIYDNFQSLDFVLVYPPIDEHVMDPNPQYVRGALRMLKTLMQMGGVGSLHCGNGYYGNWKMTFCESQNYWTDKDGPGNLQSILHHRDWRRSR